jgi:hypothetical protein
MKKIFSLLMLLTVYGVAPAQSYTGLVDYQKASRQAVLGELSYPDNEIVSALQDTMARLGFKPKSSKGFMLFKAATLSAFGNEAFDIYFSVDRKSRKEKEISVITMMLSRGGDNFITQGTDAGVIENAKIFLNGFINSMYSYDLEQQISAQQDVTDKAEKKARNLAEDADDLQKKFKKLEKEIDENAKDQVQQKGEVEKQRQELDNLKSRRKQ